VLTDKETQDLDDVLMELENYRLTGRLRSLYLADTMLVKIFREAHETRVTTNTDKLR
jgi:hypothetical protein